VRVLHRTWLRLRELALVALLRRPRAASVALPAGVKRSSARFHRRLPL
jgi:hypothetical protein